MTSRLLPASRPLFLAALLALATGCRGEGHGRPVRVRVPNGASFAQVADSLAARGIIRKPDLLFRLYARIRGADHQVKPGTYAFRPGTGWDRILEDLRLGRVLTVRIVIPEGWDLRAIAPRLATATGLPADSILATLRDTARARLFGVPGPTLEGYLYPATYSIPVDLPLDTIIARMVARYRHAWTPARQARADSLGFSEREIVTLASIIEKEAKHRDEMPLISAVYHNRLRIGYPLQADPTVQYALGRHHPRLLYAHIDSAAADPYNTYRRRGLPPGPIASPSVYAIDAALHPANVDYLYFVARPDGSHIFTRSLAEHNRVKTALRRNAAGRPHRTTPMSGPAGTR